MNHAKFERYDSYKDSGVEWIGEVPEHWNVKRLKELSNIQNSNVDKKSNENEKPVQLCNYVDVYKNEFINASLHFMWATADNSEIMRFKIRRNDVLITKDSETCDDIAVPALTTESLKDVLCGYHLAQIRTKDDVVSGSYMFRLFQSENYGFRFVILAKGITRVGLGQSAISDSLTPVPPISEQTAITVYLDTKTAQIDRKIDLLTQKAKQYGKLKQSLINETVTRGLDKTVTMKDSGVGWIGSVPEHWEVTAITNVTNKVSIKNHPKEQLLSVYRDYGVIIKNTREDNHNKAGADLSSYKLVEPGYLVINKMKTWQGSLGISEFRGIVSPAYITCKTDRQIVERAYLHHLLRCRNYINEYNRLSYGVRVDQWDMRYDDFKYVPVLLPPLEEQRAIANYLNTETSQLDFIITTINTQIDKLKELRKTLINDVVTGKIKVVKEGKTHE